ncbi:MAG: STAS domain-containing protein [Gammaproteobacteria bacterium]|nr:STAS domain-containing protein [Gammaproteobacteria bacterium]
MTTGKSTVKKKRVATKKATTRKTASKKNAAIDKLAAKTPVKTDEKESTSNEMIVLSPVLIINNAKALSLDLSQLLQSSNDITIDASAVEMIDTAILQLLLAVTNKVKSAKHEVHWPNPSATFISTVNILGLSKPLGIS